MPRKEKFISKIVLIYSFAFNTPPIEIIVRQKTQHESNRIRKFRNAHL